MMKHQWLNVGKKTEKCLRSALSVMLGALMMALSFVSCKLWRPFQPNMYGVPYEAYDTDGQPDDDKEQQADSTNSVEKQDTATELPDTDK